VQTATTAMFHYQVVSRKYNAKISTDRWQWKVAAVPGGKFVL